MPRVLVQRGGLTLYPYPTMLSLGCVLGLFAQQWAAARMGLDVVHTSAATLLLLGPAMLGARLLFVFSHWNEYRREPKLIWRTSEGGAAMYGGLILAVPLCVPVLAVLGIPVGAFWDVASYTMLVGMIVTRVGCFLNGCCAGAPTERWFGVHLPDDHGVWRRRIPTQVLEAAWGIAVLGGCLVLERSLPFRGALFLYTVSAYAIGRVVLESTRERQDRIFGVALQSALSLLFASVALAVLTLTWRN